MFSPVIFYLVFLLELSSGLTIPSNSSLSAQRVIVYNPSDTPYFLIVNIGEQSLRCHPIERFLKDV